MKALIFIFVVSTTITNAQQLIIKDANLTSSHKVINLTLKNDKTKFQFYKMEIEDICNSLVNIKFIETKSMFPQYLLFQGC
jgi:hypothetical protein